MFKSTLMATALAMVLSGSAVADDDDKSRKKDYSRYRSDDYGDRYDDRRYDDWRYDDRRYDDRRYPRNWRHVPPVHFRGSNGYRAGYESGWREASQYCRIDYRPGRWYHDRNDYWYFGFGSGN